MLIMAFEGIAVVHVSYVCKHRNLQELSNLVTLGPLVATALGLWVTILLSYLGLGI